MNRTVFSLPAHSEYRTRGGLAVTRSVEQFSGGANRLDDLIELLDRRRGVVLSSGTTVPAAMSFDLAFRSAVAAGNDQPAFSLKR
jgi:anthranilate synthase